MSNTELLIEEVKTLPANLVKDVLQFIENLKQENTTGNIPYSADCPAFSPEDALKVSAQKISSPNREPISRYFGCLKNSKAFAGDPLEIQRQMRAEWIRD